MAIRICPSCGKKVSSTRTTCSHCGSVLEFKNFCPECEEETDINAPECPVCGYEFDRDNISKNVETVLAKENKIKEKIAVILLWSFLGFAALAYFINLVIAISVGRKLSWMFEYIKEGYIAGFICMGVGIIGFIISLILLFTCKNAKSVKIKITAISLMVALLFVTFAPLIFYDPLRYERKDGDTYSITYCYRNSVNVNIPSTYIGVAVTKIDDYIFANFDKLTSVTIPDSIVSIGKGAFYGCKNLTSISIPDSVTTIGESAFAHCYSLNNITIGNGLTAISDSMFEFSELTSIEMSDSVITIGSRAFACSNLTSIEIPISVTTIGFCAFENCDSLTSIVLPDGVTTIGHLAFQNCTSLTSVVIPTSVTTIEHGLFAGCTNLKTIKYRGTKAQWSAITEGTDWDWNFGDYTIIYDYAD